MNVKKLREKSLLSILNVDSGRPPKDYKNHIVSKDIRRLLLMLATDKKLSSEDIDELNPDDKVLLDYLYRKSGRDPLIPVHRPAPVPTPVSLGSSLVRKKAKVRILMGEIEAGNNNPVLVTELLALVRDLTAKKVFTKTELIEIENIYCA